MVRQRDVAAVCRARRTCGGDEGVGAVDRHPGQEHEEAVGRVRDRVGLHEQPDRGDNPR